MFPLLFGPLRTPPTGESDVQWLSFLYLSCMAIVLVLRSGILSRMRFLHMLLFFNDEFIGYFSLVQTKITETNISVFTFY